MGSRIIIIIFLLSGLFRVSSQNMNQVNQKDTLVFQLNKSFLKSSELNHNIYSLNTKDGEGRIIFSLKRIIPIVGYSKILDLKEFLNSDAFFNKIYCGYNYQNILERFNSNVIVFVEMLNSTDKIFYEVITYYEIQ